MENKPNQETGVPADNSFSDDVLHPVPGSQPPIPEETELESGLEPEDEPEETDPENETDGEPEKVPAISALPTQFRNINAIHSSKDDEENLLPNDQQTQAAKSFEPPEHRPDALIIDDPRDSETVPPASPEPIQEPEGDPESEEDADKGEMPNQKRAAVGFRTILPPLPLIVQEQPDEEDEPSAEVKIQNLTHVSIESKLDTAPSTEVEPDSDEEIEPRSLVELMAELLPEQVDAVYGTIESMIVQQKQLGPMVILNIMAQSIHNALMPGETSADLQLSGIVNELPVPVQVELFAKIESIYGQKGFANRTIVTQAVVYIQEAINENPKK